MLRLLFVTSSFEHGGAERHTITLLNGLAERGHESHAVFIKNRREQLDRLRLAAGGTVRCLDAQRRWDRRALADLARVIGDLHPHVIVAANEYALLYAALAKSRARAEAALVVTFHAMRTVGPKECLKLVACRPFFWSADCAVFVCESQRRRWCRRALFARRNEVIHNGVDVEEFADRGHAGERAAVRDALGFGDSDYIIGITAALRPEKNHVQLVDAVARLHARGIPARALLIGDGEMRTVIDARARALGVAEHVRITGYQTDVRPYVLAADVVVLCSLTEALSLAALEAMALSRPVVHSDVGGAAELIVPGESGFLFAPRDTDALVERLASLADRAVSKRMGRRARAVVVSGFAEDVMIERYEQLLLEVSAARAAKNASRAARAGAGVRAPAE